MARASARRLLGALRGARERHAARHEPSGFEFAIADGIRYLDGAHWDALTSKQKLRRMFGKTPPVPTKRVDKVTKETRQLVLSSGPKFILRRLKAALRRGEITITPSGMIEAVDNPYRHIERIVRDL
jgi:hypothetical protein